MTKFPTVISSLFKSGGWKNSKVTYHWLSFTNASILSCVWKSSSICVSGVELLEKQPWEAGLTCFVSPTPFFPYMLIGLLNKFAITTYGLFFGSVFYQNCQGLCLKSWKFLILGHSNSDPLIISGLQKCRGLHLATFTWQYISNANETCLTTMIEYF